MATAVFLIKKTSEIRQALYERYNGACAFCGATNVPLELAPIVPLSKGGEFEIENYLLLCPKCHEKIVTSTPREIEFIGYLTELISKNPNYRNLKKEVHLASDQHYGGDIAIEKKTKSGWRELIVECKNYSALTSSRLDALVNQLVTYKSLVGNRDLVLAIPGLISDTDKEKFKDKEIELWDMDFLALEFKEQIVQTEHPFYQPLFLSVVSRQKRDEEQNLLAQLKGCRPGRTEWPNYQKLITRVLEFLFCPPLRTPISELADTSKVNRRDIILPNYSSDGFWKYLRETYGAHYIVIDTKNYKEKVTKKDVLQIANYLKSHGAGLFGIIICRKEGDTGCHHTIREQWVAYKKMIIILNDNDIEAMLLAKLSGGNPEDIVSQKIEDFRLSM